MIEQNKNQYLVGIEKFEWFLFTEKPPAKPAVASSMDKIPDM